MTLRACIDALAAELEAVHWLETAVSEERGQVVIVVEPAELADVEASVRAALKAAGLSVPWLAGQQYGSRLVTVQLWG